MWADEKLWVLAILTYDQISTLAHISDTEQTLTFLNLSTLVY